MADLLTHRLEVIAAEAATALRQAATPRDWLDEILDADGDGLKSDEAAHIARVHVDTIRERAKAQPRRPISRSEF